MHMYTRNCAGTCASPNQWQIRAIVWLYARHGVVFKATQLRGSNAAVTALKWYFDLALFVRFAL